MSTTDLDEFARGLAAQVEEGLQSEDGEPFSEAEFTKLILEKLGEEGVLENPTLLWQAGTFDRTKYKITGFAQSDDDDRVLLTTTIYTGDVPPRAVGREEIMEAFRLAINFYKCSCDGLHEHIDPAKTEASDLAHRIFEVRKKIEVLRVVLISDGLLGYKSIDLKKAFDGTRVVVDMFGIEELNRILGEGQTRDDIVLDLRNADGIPLASLRATGEEAGYDAFLTAIPGAVLADVYEKYGTRLLELNVRAFLGVRGRKTVNAGLRRTIQEEPNRFLAYNNGIVATVDDVELISDAAGNLGIQSVRGLQIVNGGQTTASLHRARRQDGATLEGIMVPAKIIRLKGENLDEMVMAISRSANSQNTVQPADFSANDPFHVAVDDLANNTWLLDGKSRWFYERARGSYGAAELKASFKATERRRFANETPKARRFLKTDLAKYLNAWAQLPHYVSCGSQKNFQYFMQSLKENHPEGLKPDEMWFKAFIGKAILFRSIQSIVKAKKFPAYQAIICAYTAALLANRTKDRIDYELLWSRQAISKQLISMIESWVVKVDQALRSAAGAQMPTEKAKKEECWKIVQKTELQIPATLPPELKWISRAYSDAEVPETAPDAELPDTDGSDEEYEKADMILNLRQLFNGRGPRSREEIIAELSKLSDRQGGGAAAYEEAASAVRTAVRRQILESNGDTLTVATNSILNYERDDLKDHFLASLQGRGWIEREDSLPGLARWLGFKRTGKSIEDIGKSLINGLIREGRLESRGSEIRRT